MVQQIKTKRWYRRNRHTNPELVRAYKDAQWNFEYFNEYHVVISNKQIAQRIPNFFFINGFRAVSFSDLKWYLGKIKEM